MQIEIKNEEKVGEQEMERFLGILLISGCHILPHVNHYWSTQEDLWVQIVYNALSRNRFQENKKYFQRANNQNLVPCQVDILLLFLINKIQLHHYFYYK